MSAAQQQASLPFCPPCLLRRAHNMHVDVLQQTQSRKLQNLKDRLILKKEDIINTKNLLVTEAVELNARKEQREKILERITSVLVEMDDEAAARADAKVTRPRSSSRAQCRS